MGTADNSNLEQVEGQECGTLVNTCLDASSENPGHPALLLKNFRPPVFQALQIHGIRGGHKRLGWSG